MTIESNPVLARNCSSSVRGADKPCSRTVLKATLLLTHAKVGYDDDDDDGGLVLAIASSI